MEEKKLSVGAKIGYFFLALVPFIAFWIIQFASIIIAIMPHMTEVITVLSNGDNEAYENIIYDCLPASIIIMHVSIIVIFGLWYFFGREKSKDKKFHINGRTILSCIAMAFAMSFMSNTTVLIQEKFMPTVVENYEQTAELSGLGTSILTMISALLLAPIGEELICRGVTFMYARKSLPFWFANTLQSLIFAVMHANLVQGTFAFLIGLILGYSVKKYNSVIPAMIMHFLVNSVASFAWGIVFLGISANIASIIMTVIISVVSISACLVLMKNEKI